MKMLNKLKVQLFKMVWKTDFLKLQQVVSSGANMGGLEKFFGVLLCFYTIKHLFLRK